MTAKVADKVRKLLAQAKSAEDIGNEAEALAFAERADALMLQYRLELSDIEIEELPNIEIDMEVINWGTYGIPTTKRRCGWLELLAEIVSKANACKVVVRTGSNHLGVVGSCLNRKMAIYLIGSLSRFAQEAEQRARKKAKKSLGFTPPKFKQGFLLGFCVALAERYYERRKVAWKGTRALVIVDQEASAVEDWMNKFGTTVSSVSVGSLESKIALHEGMEAGKQANIDASGQITQ